MIRVPIATLLRAVGVAALSAVVMSPAFAVNQSLLVFPVDKPESVDQSVADTVLSGLRARVGSGVKYDAMTFSAKSALVMRAVAGGSITAVQAAGPFTAESASTIARAVGADAALIASVEDATVDTAASKATVTISAQLVSAADGKPLKTAGASGDAVLASTPDLALLRLAADNAASKAVAQLFGSSATPGAPVAVLKPGQTSGATPQGAIAIPEGGKKAKKGNKSGLLIGGLVLAAVSIASSHSGGGGGSNTGGGPPPFPF